MANEQNLKPFTGADDPRRANGPPKGVPHSKTRLKRLLQITENLTNPITKETEGFSVAEQLDLAQIVRAKKGDTRAYTALMDRLEGKPTQYVDMDVGDKVKETTEQKIKDFLNDTNDLQDDSAANEAGDDSQVAIPPTDIS